MSSTEFTVGLSEGTRNSSKVLKPPGGGSSDIFNFGGNKQNTTQNRLFGAPIEHNVTPRTPAKSSNIFGIEQKTEAVRSVTKKHYVRRNPITGEVTEIYSAKNGNKEENEDDKEPGDVKDVEKEPEPKKIVQTSIRVRNPPGGKSSGIF